MTISTTRLTKIQEHLVNDKDKINSFASKGDDDRRSILLSMSKELSLELSNEDVEDIIKDPDQLLDGIELDDETMLAVAGGKGRESKTINASSLNNKTTHLPGDVDYTIQGNLNNATINSPGSSIDLQGNMNNSHINTG